MLISDTVQQQDCTSRHGTEIEWHLEVLRKAVDVAAQVLQIEAELCGRLPG